MAKNEYKDKVYKMRYKEFSKILSRRLMEVKECKGYEAFKEDVKILREIRSNCGRASLISNYWMKAICNMPKNELIKFVNEYEKGKFDPYKYDPEKKYEKEINNEEEEESI